MTAEGRGAVAGRGPVAVIGAGGHAKVVIATLQAAGFAVTAVFDDASAKWGSELLGVPVRGAVAELAGLDGVALVIAIGDNAARAKMAARLGEGRPWVSVVHPGALVHPSVKLGPGTVVFAGAVVQPDTRIGAHAIVNTGASVDHDCRIGDFAHLAPGVRLAGGVEVGDGALLGIGSVVKPSLVVGAWTTVGAGGAVVNDLPGGITAAGVPAKPLGGKKL